MADSGNGTNFNRLILDELKSLKKEMSDSREHVIQIKQDVASLKGLKDNIKSVEKRLDSESENVVRIDGRVDELERENAVLKEVKASQRLAELERREQRRQGRTAAIAAITGTVTALITIIVRLLAGY